MTVGHNDKQRVNWPVYLLTAVCGGVKQARLINATCVHRVGVPPPFGFPKKQTIKIVNIFRALQ